MAQETTPAVARAEIVKEARSWIGVRWRHQGRSKKTGTDCAGVVIGTGAALGLTDYDYRTYRAGRAVEGFVRHFRAGGARLKRVGDRKPGDILLFEQNGHTSHAGILTEKGGKEFLVHAQANFRRVVEHRLSDSWVKRITHCFAFPGVED